MLITTSYRSPRIAWFYLYEMFQLRKSIYSDPYTYEWLPGAGGGKIRSGGMIASCRFEVSFGDDKSVLKFMVVTTLKITIWKKTFFLFLKVSSPVRNTSCFPWGKGPNRWSCKGYRFPQALDSAYYKPSILLQGDVSGGCQGDVSGGCQGEVADDLPIWATAFCLPVWAQWCKINRCFVFTGDGFECLGL